MGLFTTLARTVTRGVTQALKKQTGSVTKTILRQEVLLQQTPFAKLAKEPPTQKWLNFAHSSFYYNSLAANLRRNATQSFLSRNGSKTPLIAFAGFCLANYDQQNDNENVCHLLGDLNVDVILRNEIIKVIPEKCQILELDVEEASKENNDDVVFKNDVSEKGLNVIVEEPVMIQPNDEKNNECISKVSDLVDDHPEAVSKNVTAISENVGDEIVGDAIFASNVCVRESLKDYLIRNNEIDHGKRLALFCQLLEGVAFMEQNNNITLCSLNSDDIFVTENDSYIGFELFLPYSNANKHDLDEMSMKTNALACGCLAHEIFHFRDDEDLVEISINSGYCLIDEVIRKLLWIDPFVRLTATEASIIITMILYAPSQWMNNPEMVPNIAIQNWIERMAVNIDDNDILLKFVFLSNITSIDIQNALFLFQTM